ncbi:MAG: nitroreductase family protein [Pseudomonadota bacterium]|nr:nitroreductase family protein [Pseudomonadota bacterium]
MTKNSISGDELLTTTRAVRKRLQLDKTIPEELINECFEIALQAPTGGNAQSWQFVVVYDAKKRAALADLYRKAWSRYKQSPGSVFDLAEKETENKRKDQLVRVGESADYLVENLHRVPVHVIPCVTGRVEKLSGSFASVGLASIYGSIIPATWSFMLAGRARGLGTCWTTAHLMYEKEAAEILEIPYDKVTQIALIATAFFKGEGFKPALRKPLETALHINKW